ncbi:hypothetical protein ACQUJO_10615 [Ralstonia pseudosolanacearum]
MKFGYLWAHSALLAFIDIGWGENWHCFKTRRFGGEKLHLRNNAMKPRMNSGVENPV